MIVKITLDCKGNNSEVTDRDELGANSKPLVVEANFWKKGWIFRKIDLPQQLNVFKTHRSFNYNTAVLACTRVK